VDQHPIPGDRAPAVTIIGWHGTALGCRRWGHACYSGNASMFKRLVIWRSVFLFFGTRRVLRVRDRVRVALVTGLG